MKKEKIRKGKNFIGVGCGALIVNNKNETLLMKRGKGSRNEEGVWSEPGGAVDFGEKIQDAIKREIKEELDIEVEICDFLAVIDHIILEENQHWVTTSYLAKIIKGEPKNLEPHKCSEIRWFSLDNPPASLNQPTKEAIDAYRKSKL